MGYNAGMMGQFDLDILYEGGGCLAVCKPAGLLTQAPPGIDSLEVRIKAFLGRRGGGRGEVYLGVPHRLDRPASGVMVFATRRSAARRLARQFERRSIEKTYYACVEGVVEPEAGTWVDYLRKVPDEARAEVVSPQHAEGRRAVMHYRVRGRWDWGTWLEVALETGRTHQVRVQCGWRGHPILGDQQYGSGVPFGRQHEDPRLRAIGLHARRLGFRHPRTRQPIEVTAPLTDDWRALGIEGQ